VSYYQAVVLYTVYNFNFILAVANKYAALTVIFTVSDFEAYGQHACMWVSWRLVNSPEQVF